MSISNDYETGVNEHLSRIKNYLNPNGTGSLADGLFAVRAIHTYAYNIHDTQEMSFVSLLRTYPTVQKAFGGFLNGSDMHDQNYFGSKEFDKARKDNSLVLQAQGFLKVYKNQVISNLENRKHSS